VSVKGVEEVVDCEWFDEVFDCECDEVEWGICFVDFVEGG